MQGVGVGAGAVQAHVQAGGPGGIQGDAGQRERQPRPGRLVIAAFERAQRMQGGVEQRRMHTVAANVGVGRQGDLRVDSVGIGRVVTDADHTLERRVILQALGCQLVVKASRVDRLHQRCRHRRGGGRSGGAKGARRVEDPGTRAAVVGGTAVHGELPSLGVVDRLNRYLQIDGHGVRQRQRGVQDEFVDGGASGLLAGVEQQVDEPGRRQYCRVVDAVRRQPGVSGGRQPPGQHHHLVRVSQRGDCS
ncbi:hypothetical protein MSIMFI_05475 [Mycobacterium simulans]|nr:hypothetical protein MSIMFI_05475 [Mycobacterium simulans]